MDPGPPLLACLWHGLEYDIATGQSFMGAWARKPVGPQVRRQGPARAGSPR
jgi:nitrite reductase/ring-hydroxylating ferredoxin subunit